MSGDMIPPRETPVPSAEGAGRGSHPGRAAYFQAPPSKGIAWSRYMEGLARRKWLLAAIVLAGTALGFVVASFVKPQYTVESTLWISTEASRGRERGPIRAGELLESYAWVELLNSHAILDPVVTKLNLNVIPANPEHRGILSGLALSDSVRPGEYRVRLAPGGESYALETGGGAVLQRSGVGTPLGGEAGFQWVPPVEVLREEEAVAFRIIRPRHAANDLRSRLTPQLSRDGSFLRLTLEGEQPELLAATMNTLSEEFVAVAEDLKKRKLTELAGIIEDQLQYSQTRLRDAEMSLENFRVNTISLPTEGVAVAAGLEVTRDPVMGSFFELKVQREQVRRERLLLEQTLRALVRGTASVDAFYAVPSVETAPELSAALSELATKEAEIRALRYRFTDQYEGVQELQKAVDMLRTRTIPSLAGALIDRLRRQEQQIEGQIASSSREIQEIPTRTIEEMRLRRAVETSEDLFNNLQARYEEARLAEASAIPDLRVLDAATVPERPSEHEAPRVVLMMFLASLGLGVGSVVLLEHRDRRFRYPEQASDELGLAILGATPRASSAAGAASGNDETAVQTVEAFRTIRMNLAHAYGTAGPMIMAVSSPTSGDGKSFVASNLAFSYAEAGFRTLLVDGDIRRGDLHRLFGITRCPGLTDVLVGDAAYENILHPTPYPNLHVIPSGTRIRRGPELLGSDGFGSLLARFKQQYDVIIIDTSPLNAGIDPYVLGTAAGNVLLVLRAGETDRKLASAKLEMMDRLPIRILGAVLNDIQPQGAYQYYSYDYGYSVERRLSKPVTRSS